VQAAALERERVLILEDEPIIALDTQEICERAGASVVLAPTVPQALRFAEDPAISAEPVCQALGRRRVPFIFFTGMRQWPQNRWPAIPVVQKPAVPAAILGALKFVLLADPHDVGLEARDRDDETLARIDQLIAEGDNSGSCVSVTPLRSSTRRVLIPRPARACLRR